MNPIAKRTLAFAGTAVAAAVVVAMLGTPANAGAYKTFGSMYFWDNNFNNSNIGISFGSGSTPNATVSFNFSSSSLYGYPAAIRGWHYGWNPTGDTKYPRQISALGTDNAYFSFNSGGSNLHGDFAYDLFLRHDSSRSTPQTEVMIWTRNNSWPVGTKVRTNTVNGQDLWMGYNSAAGYETFSFVPAGTGGGSGWSSASGSLNINLTQYLNYLVSNYNGYVKSSDYLDVVEAGLEINSGNGWAWMQMSN